MPKAQRVSPNCFPKGWHRLMLWPAEHRSDCVLSDIDLSNLTSYFEIIVDSHAIERNRTQRSREPLIQVPPMVPSCKTTARCITTRMQLRCRAPPHRGAPSCGHTGLPPPTSPSDPSNHESVLHFSIFVVSRMVYKWNHEVTFLSKKQMELTYRQKNYRKRIFELASLWPSSVQ